MEGLPSGLKRPVTNDMVDFINLGLLKFPYNPAIALLIVDALILTLLSISVGFLLKILCSIPPVYNCEFDSWVNIPALGVEPSPDGPFVVGAHSQD